MRIIGFLLLGFMCFSSCHNKQKNKAVSEVQPGKKKLSDAKEVTRISTLTDTAEINKTLREGNTWVQKSPDSAITYYLHGLELCGRINYPEGKVIAYNNLSCCYEMKKDYKKANDYVVQLKRALYHIPGPYYNERRHKKLLGQKYSYRALSFYESGNYDSASAWYLKTVEALKPPDSTTYNTLAMSYVGLGAIAGRLSNRAGSLSYFNLAEDVATQYADTSLMVTVLSNKAVLILDDKDYNQARTVAKKALAMASKINSNRYYGQLANTIAISLIKEQKPEEALPYSKMVWEAAEQNHADLDKVTAHYVLGYNYVELKKYSIAKEYLLSGLKLALALKNIDNITNAYEQLAAAYEGLGQYGKALEYEKKYVAIRDSLLGHENAARIAEVETRYRVIQKDKELAQKDKVLLQSQLKIASQQKKQYLWIGAASACIFLLLGLLRHKRYKVKLARLKATVAGEERERSRLAKELHDGIVSRLSIIKMNFSALPQQYRSLSEAADFQDVVDQLEQSIIELRTTSHNLLPEILQRAGLAESLKIYCEKIRKIALLDIEFQLLGELPLLTNDFQLNIYRIIQELVNNIVKHSNATHALIQFQVREEQLNITIDDNGNGIQGDISQNMGKGIGMQNLHDRIRLLNGTIEIERQKGTSVYMEFNMKKFIQKV
jgi:signal transduction histidine kinase